jgi:hypothetical protein
MVFTIASPRNITRYYEGLVKITTTLYKLLIFIGIFVVIREDYHTLNDTL